MINKNSNHLTQLLLALALIQASFPVLSFFMQLLEESGENIALPYFSFFILIMGLLAFIVARKKGTLKRVFILIFSLLLLLVLVLEFYFGHGEGLLGKLIFNIKLLLEMMKQGKYLIMSALFFRVFVSPVILISLIYLQIFSKEMTDSTT